MNVLCRFSLLTVLTIPSAFAATPIDLSHIQRAKLHAMFSAVTTPTPFKPDLKEFSVHVDQNQMSHVRVQQTFSGYPVWGGDAVIHTQNKPPGTMKSFALLSSDNATTMNGIVYDGLQSDLIDSPEKVFTNDSAKRALKQAIVQFSEKSGNHYVISDRKTTAMVALDSQNKAHWSWLVRFRADTAQGELAVPTFIIDAMTGEVYKQWNDLQTDAVLVEGGGYGGNPKTGKLIYDGAPGNLSKLQIFRDNEKSMCYLQNKDVIVANASQGTGNVVTQYPCDKVDANHNNIFWNNLLHASNGAYSPDNDALFIGDIIKKLYREWYNVPVLKQDDGSPMVLVMRVQDKQTGANAYWYSGKMTFGTGNDNYYPFVSLTIGAHEVSHGFTEQHSRLLYADQSGGLNESFSDMAGAAAEYYVFGKTTWLHGWEVPKTGAANRFMDEPTKDCKPDPQPGEQCSIDKASDYYQGLDVHYSSGVFNRAFYLLATSKDWNVRKAFDVMVKANQDYWTATTTFQEAACGVQKAAKDLKYPLTAVNAALKAVALDPSKC
ncbi:MAG: M4 family metallopeptidase [Gammaproteobacteria bacterium]|nr:M4 family metallopeptidase [Gammaproteobacteria bacterium]